MVGTLESALVHAVTKLDRRDEVRALRSMRGYHNRYALPQYLQRIDEVLADVEAGASVREALVAGFSGRLLDACLKAVDELKATDSEINGGSWVYEPASRRGL